MVFTGITATYLSTIIMLWFVESDMQLSNRCNILPLGIMPILFLRNIESLVSIAGFIALG